MEYWKFHIWSCWKCVYFDCCNDVIYASFHDKFVIIGKMWLFNYANNMNIAGYFLRIWNIMVCNEQHANVWTSCTPFHVIHPVVIIKVCVTAVVVNFRMWYHSLKKIIVEVVELLVPVWELRESWRSWTRYVCILCHWLQTVKWLMRLSHWSLTVESQVQFEATSHGFCSGQSDNGTGLSLRTSLFPCLFHFINTPHSVIYHQHYVILAVDSVNK
jgi:hypothetical protein